MKNCYIIQADGGSMDMTGILFDGIHWMIRNGSKREIALSIRKWKSGFDLRVRFREATLGRRRRRCPSCGELKFGVRRRPDDYRRDVFNDKDATIVECGDCAQAGRDDI